MRPRRRLWAVVGLFFAAGRSVAAGGACRYGERIQMADGKTTTLYYRVAEAYVAADSVVIGKVVGRSAGGYDLRFHVADIVKGPPEREIVLRGQGGDPAKRDGFSIPAGKTVLLLLRRSSPGHYDSVEGYQSDCATYYEISWGKVLLTPLLGAKGGIRLPVKSLVNYFSSRPAPLTSELK